MVAEDKGGRVSGDKAKEQRESKHSTHVTPYPDTINDDGSIRDEPARAFAHRQYAVASQAPNERAADDDAVGTPAWHDEHSPDNMKSDGGPTLAYDLDGKSVLSVLDSYKDNAKSEEDAKTDKDRENERKAADKKDK